MICLFPQLNLVGVKDDTPVHFCDKCGLPIKIYGRMVRNMSLKLKKILYTARDLVLKCFFFFFFRFPVSMFSAMTVHCTMRRNATRCALGEFLLGMFEVQMILLKTHGVHPWYIKFGCSVPLNVACKVQANQENLKILFPW